MSSRTETFAWDMPTRCMDGSAIPAGSVIEYELNQVKIGLPDTPILTTQFTQVTVAFDDANGVDFYVTARILPNGQESAGSNVLHLTYAPPVLNPPTNLRVV